jgi:hypothetical protein
MNGLENYLASLLPQCYYCLSSTFSVSRNKGFSREIKMGLWKPGESGNPKGRRPKRLFDDRLREALGSRRGEKAKLLVDKLIAKASTGNVAALKLVCERVGGKPKPSEPIAAPNEAQTLEQVRLQLAALLSQPEVRRNLEKLMQSETEVVQ